MATCRRHQGTKLRAESQRGGHTLEEPVYTTLLRGQWQKWRQLSGRARTSGRRLTGTGFALPDPDRVNAMAVRL